MRLAYKNVNKVSVIIPLHLDFLHSKQIRKRKVKKIFFLISKNYKVDKICEKCKGEQEKISIKQSFKT